MTEFRTRLGADIGGTFTDVVLEHEGVRFSTKVLTTYSAPENAIIEGMERVCKQASISPEKIDQIIHGTTLATNALIERRGAKTAFVTTEGFRDVIEMRTESRFEQYDLNLKLPDPLLARNRRFTVTERMDAQGNALVPLDEASVDAVIEALKKGDYDSVAIGFLHSYVNDAHERAVARRIQDALPNAMLSLSCEVSPQMREYERFNTTIANAYIKPLMKSYLDRLSERMKDAGADCPIFLMHSGGGIMSLENAAEFPVRLVESGPAGGAIFAATIAAQHGISKVLSFDMGGTTAKICLIKDQTPKTARVFEVARSYRFKKGSGMPISIPVIDMVEIGAGGGSLAHIDALNQIRVGPESAGSEPGPACYGRGGARPAVTDADLVMGRLDPDNFAGGSIPLLPDEAAQALAKELGEPLKMGAQEAAWGLSEVVDENMANAARVHAVENGEDLSEYTMIAFGGAAPLHAARLCEKLGIDKCLVPQGAGVGSAIGFLQAPFSFEANRSVFMRLDQFDRDQIVELFEALTKEASEFVRKCDATAEILTEYKIYMRYVGQGWEIPITLTQDEALQPDANRFLEKFEKDYTSLFGRSVEGLDTEITVWSVNATTQADDVEPVQPVDTRTWVQEAETRPLFDPALGQEIAANMLQRDGLSDHDAIAGPAMITERETTVIVPHSRNAHLETDGTIVLTTKEPSHD